MLEVMTWGARIAAGLAFVIALVWLFAPREPVETNIAFDPATLPKDLDAHLAQLEAAVPGITPGVEKRIIWHGATGVQTDLAVVYIHGFSATSEEIRPVPDRVAEALGANLYFTRLTGHGRDGAAMAAATVGDWMHDVAEAYAIGHRLGREVLVISTSTGATLAAATALDPQMSKRIKGHVFVSPNFGLANPAGALLGWPAARYWAPLLVGAERSFETRNADHARFWTTRYPTVATMPMAAIVKHIRAQDMARVKLPALFLFSDEDKVVSPRATREVAARWGAPAILQPLTMGPEDDVYSHILAGDILSPGQTARAVDVILDWVRALPATPD